MVGVQNTAIIHKIMIELQVKELIDIGSVANVLAAT